MGPGLNDPPGATPLDPDERAALIPSHITTQGQLNEWEHQNILEGTRWAMRSRRQDLLSTSFMQALHRRMLGATWQWAGRLRTTEKNIGVAPEQIVVRLLTLCGDAHYQLEHNSYPIRELAARFHHRLVHIHPFANGNGRHARLMTDLLLRRQGQMPFAWGGGDLAAAGDIRRRYIEALRSADEGNYGPLLQFLEVV